MRPRTRRRLGRSAGALVVAVVAGASVHHFSASAGSQSSPPERRMQTGAQNGGIAYGATPKQVLTALGSPTTKHSACWSYQAHAHTVNREYLGKFVDGLRYCFGDGPAGGKAVTAIYEHIVPHRLPNKTWYPGGWNYAMTLMPASAAKLQS